MNKITDVLIRNSKYGLWSIPDKEHKLGKLNGESGSLWVRKDEDEIFDEGEKPEWIPWLDKSAKRNCWSINIMEGNSMKYKYDDPIIRKYTNAIISLDNKKVYDVSGYDFDFCYNEARNKIYHLESLLEQDVNLKDVSKESGRNIFYKNLPSKIKIIFNDGGMIIEPDCKVDEWDDWWDMLIMPWWDNSSLEWWEESKEDGNLKVDILSDNILWHRDDRDIKLRKIKRKINGK